MIGRVNGGWFTVRIPPAQPKTKATLNRVTFVFGWAGGIRTHEMTESKSVALPLGYSPKYLDKEKAAFASRFLMGWVVRVELTTSRATIWRPNQLGHTHHNYVARQERLELPTYCLEGSCSIQLSYWRIFIGAGDGNRTHATSLEGWNSTIELHPQVLL